MDADHAEEPTMTVGTGDGSVAIGTLTGLVMMRDIGDIIATEDLTGMMTGEIAIETGTATGPGVGAAVRLRTVNCTARSRLSLIMRCDYEGDYHSDADSLVFLYQC